MLFYSISSNIDEVLSISQSANVFVVGDFNVHHKDWLTYSGGTERPGELCYNFSISNELTQIVNFPTGIPDCDCHSPALMDLFISSDAGICSSMTFPPLGYSDHVVVLVSIDVPINSKQDAPFHRVAYGGFCMGLSSFSITHMHGLAVYVKEGLPFARDLSLENSADSSLCF